MLFSSFPPPPPPSPPPPSPSPPPSPPPFLKETTPPGRWTEIKEDSQCPPSLRLSSPPTLAAVVAEEGQTGVTSPPGECPPTNICSSDSPVTFLSQVIGPYCLRMPKSEEEINKAETLDEVCLGGDNPPTTKSREDETVSMISPFPSISCCCYHQPKVEYIINRKGKCIDKEDSLMGIDSLETDSGKVYNSEVISIGAETLDEIEKAFSGCCHL